MDHKQSLAEYEAYREKRIEESRRRLQESRKARVRSAIKWCAISMVAVFFAVGFIFFQMN